MTPLPVHLRQATAADAPRLAVLRWEFRTEIAAPAEPRERFVGRCDSWMRERLAPGSPWRAWLAEDAGESLGTVWLQLLDKVPNPVAEPERHGYVTNLYVRPAARGAGVGSALLRAALDACVAADVQDVILWPTPWSRSLYARHGFRDGGDVMIKRRGAG